MSYIWCLSFCDDNNFEKSLQSVTALEHLLCVKAIGSVKFDSTLYPLLITSHGGMLSSRLWEPLLSFPNPALPFSPCDSCSHSFSPIISLPVFLRPSHVHVNLSLPASSITVLPPTASPRLCDHLHKEGPPSQGKNYSCDRAKTVTTELELVGK